MRFRLSLLLLLLPSVVAAQSSGLQNCPLRLPFGIEVAVYGSQVEVWHRLYYAGDPNSPDSTAVIPRGDVNDVFSFWIDTNDTRCHCIMSGDTLLCSVDTTINVKTSFNGTYQAVDVPYQLTMLFDNSTASVLSLTISFVAYYYHWGDKAHRNRTVIVKNIRYTSDTLSIMDTSLQSHFVSTIDDAYYYFIHNLEDDVALTNPTLVSVRGWNNLPPLPPAPPPPIVDTSPQARPPFAAHLVQGNLQLDFAPSVRSRILESYSLIGARIGSFEISSAQTSLSIPQVPNGFYFFRLGEELHKISVLE